MQTWGVLRHNWGQGRQEREGSMAQYSKAKWQLLEAGQRLAGVHVCLLLQTVNHSRCQLWCAHYIPVILSNALVAILCQAPELGYTRNQHSVKCLISHLKCLHLGDNRQLCWIPRPSLKVWEGEWAELLCRLCKSPSPGATFLDLVKNGICIWLLKWSHVSSNLHQWWYV